jgi:hypothetical protein
MAMVVSEREGRMSEWSDGRLDEFALRVDERFDRAEEKTDERFDRAEEKTDERFDRAEQRADDRFSESNRRFDHGDREFARINDRLDDLVKVMIGGIVALTGAILAGFAALVVLFSTQL